ncbi:hypothetical protein E5Q_00948 [Mixia osmundae IAM 14324]|uniref:Uncharacterized protein n=1 Tax=Mixia osmundae (strain CBS 9802 / IAM 14324 / JCM 22182 / KY 12970) TaxID=764103 RepID=G7DUN9_MIXOS|nr:hypothetical protein E5Q_00948 [Mixia osmundae IAM 14324]
MAASTAKPAETSSSAPALRSARKHEDKERASYARLAFVRSWGPGQEARLILCETVASSIDFIASMPISVKPNSRWPSCNADGQHLVPMARAQSSSRLKLQSTLGKSGKWRVLFVNLQVRRRGGCGVLDVIGSKVNVEETRTVNNLGCWPLAFRDHRRQCVNRAPSEQAQTVFASPLRTLAHQATRVMPHERSYTAPAGEWSDKSSHSQTSINNDDDESHHGASNTKSNDPVNLAWENVESWTERHRLDRLKVKALDKSIRSRAELLAEAENDRTAALIDQTRSAEELAQAWDKVRSLTAASLAVRLVPLPRRGGIEEAEHLGQKRVRSESVQEPLETIPEPIPELISASTSTAAVVIKAVEPKEKHSNDQGRILIERLPLPPRDYAALEGQARTTRSKPAIATRINLVPDPIAPEDPTDQVPESKRLKRSTAVASSAVAAQELSNEQWQQIHCFFCAKVTACLTYPYEDGSEAAICFNCTYSKTDRGFGNRVKDASRVEAQCAALAAKLSELTPGQPAKPEQLIHELRKDAMQRILSLHHVSAMLYQIAICAPRNSVTAMATAELKAMVFDYVFADPSFTTTRFEAFRAIRGCTLWCPKTATEAKLRHLVKAAELTQRAYEGFMMPKLKTPISAATKSRYIKWWDTILLVHTVQPNISFDKLYDAFVEITHTD